MTDINKQREDRIRLFKDTVQRKKTNKVPHLANIWTWKIFDAGFRMSEAMFDYDIMLEVHRKAFEKYSVDAYLDFGQRNPLQFLTALGDTEYVIDDSTNSLSIRDQCIMEPDEYPQFIEDPVRYFWSVALPRKFKKMNEPDGAEAFKKALVELKRFGEYGATVTKLAADHGIPALSDGTCYPRGTAWGYETFFNNLRGIKGLSIDLRRKTKELDAAVEILDQMYFYPVLRDYPEEKKGSTPGAVFDGLPSMLGHTILNRRQFEKYYWPKMKLLADFAEKYDKLFYFFAEGNLEPYFQFFQELPRGHFAVHCEQTDIFKMKKEVPNVTVVGGMPYALLARGTTRECVDYAKKLVDELTDDGGFIFSEDKMISFNNECRSDNLQAVCEFLSGYEI